MVWEAVLKKRMSSYLLSHSNAQPVEISGGKWLRCDNAPYTRCHLVLITILSSYPLVQQSSTELHTLLHQHISFIPLHMELLVAREDLQFLIKLAKHVKVTKSNFWFIFLS